MGKKEQVANRQYTDEFKIEAVRLGESIGGNPAAKRLGIPESSLWNWMRLSRAGKLKAAHGSAGPVKRSVSENAWWSRCDHGPRVSGWWAGPRRLRAGGWRSV